MYSGGSDGPEGTRSKYGPVTQLIQTYSWNARRTPPMTAKILTVFDFCFTSPLDSVATLADSVISDLAFDASLTNSLLLDAPHHVGGASAIT